MKGAPTQFSDHKSGSAQKALSGVIIRRFCTRPAFANGLAKASSLAPRHQHAFQFTFTALFRMPADITMAAAEPDGT